VHNVAFEKDGTTHDSKTFICAKTTGEAGKLMVGPCFLPSWRGWTSGDYVKIFFIFFNFSGLCITMRKKVWL
jgi:hypothetical protein